MKSTFKLLTLVAAITAVSITPAMAKVTASASISNVTITLFDLNPNDGIAPTISWLASSEASFTDADVNRFDPMYFQDRQSGYQSLGAANTATASVSRATATAIVNASLLPGTPATSLSVVGSVDSGLNNSEASFSVWAFSPTNNGDNFKLSAHTMALFSLTANVGATSTEAYVGNEYAYSEVVFDLMAGYVKGSEIEQRTFASLNAWAGQGTTADVRSANWAGAIVNATDSDLSGSYSAYAHAYGYNAIAAVPEPETYALFLAGLSIIGAVVRRRNRGN
jgi:hypothetical protein